MFGWLKKFYRPEVPVPQQWEPPVFDDDDDEAPMGLSTYKYTSSDGLVHQGTIASTALDKTHAVDDTKAHDRGIHHWQIFSRTNEKN